MSRSRCFAWYSAANIDGRRGSRPALPKRSGDAWHIDPRIDDPNKPEFQCGEELYKTAQTDRGHLTRYLDVAWGATAVCAWLAACATVPEPVVITPEEEYAPEQVVVPSPLVEYPPIEPVEPPIEPEKPPL